MRWINVNDLYTNSSNNNTPLLSNYNGSFWNAYLNDYRRYDKLFCRLYRSFKYYLANSNDIVVVQPLFTDDVYNHLLLNQKRYDELYRIEVLDDDSYSITDNYDMVETLQKATSDNEELSHGQIDTTKTDIYGQRQKNVTDTLGAGQDTTTYSQGQQTNTSTSKVSPFDSNDFYNDNSVNDVIGNRQDTTSITVGGRTNTQQNVESTFTNTFNDTINKHTDTKVLEGNENYTLTRRGNIGVMTSTDVMQKAVDFWKVWGFYSLIFSEIATELLLV